MTTWYTIEILGSANAAVFPSDFKFVHVTVNGASVEPGPFATAADIAGMNRCILRTGELRRAHDSIWRTAAAASDVPWWLGVDHGAGCHRSLPGALKVAGIDHRPGRFMAPAAD